MLAYSKVIFLYLIAKEIKRPSRSRFYSKNRLQCYLKAVFSNVSAPTWARTRDQKIMSLLL